MVPSLDCARSEPCSSLARCRLRIGGKRDPAQQNLAHQRRKVVGVGFGSSLRALSYHAPRLTITHPEPRIPNPAPRIAPRHRHPCPLSIPIWISTCGASLFLDELCESKKGLLCPKLSRSIHEHALWLRFATPKKRVPQARCRDRPVASSARHLMLHFSSLFSREKNVVRSSDFQYDLCFVYLNYHIYED
jgi:hypothetical protein